LTNINHFDKIIIEFLFYSGEIGASTVSKGGKMVKYKIADIVFEALVSHSFTKKVCAAYEYNGDEPVEFSMVITKEDIDNERRRTRDFYEEYLEWLALLRKLCAYAVQNANALLFHSSAIMVDGNAYLFTAPSGTGKSTHAKLWRELLGDRAVMINDDKPIVREVDGEFFVYGTPWNGKHRLDSNIKAKLKAICILNRAAENSIRKASTKEMLLTILNQTIRPEQVGDMDKLLKLIEKMITSVELYSLGCNTQISAAKLSYETMSGEKL